MNTQAIQKKLDEYMETATPEQVVKEFEDLGVEFVNTNDMNLIQQLQQTPKWKEFEEWYNNYYLTNKHVPSLNTLEQVPYEMYKGVFEKFFESQGFNIEKQLQDISYYDRAKMSKEEILSQRYVEEYFIRTIFLIHDEYKTHCLNPQDYRGNSTPFYTFEELLLWYFNN